MRIMTDNSVRLRHRHVITIIITTIAVRCVILMRIRTTLAFDVITRIMFYVVCDCYYHYHPSICYDNYYAGCASDVEHHYHGE